MCDAFVLTNCWTVTHLAIKRECCARHIFISERFRVATRLPPRTGRLATCAQRDSEFGNATRAPANATPAPCQRDSLPCGTRLVCLVELLMFHPRVNPPPLYSVLGRSFIFQRQQKQRNNGNASNPSNALETSCWLGGQAWKAAGRPD